MRRTYERGIKARLSFSGGPQAPVNMADSMEEVNVGGKKLTFAALYCAIFRSPSFRKSLKFFGTSIASLDPETVQLPAFSILSAMFTGKKETICSIFKTDTIQTYQGAKYNFFLFLIWIAAWAHLPGFRSGSGTSARSLTNQIAAFARHYPLALWEKFNIQCLMFMTKQNISQ